MFYDVVDSVLFLNWNPLRKLALAPASQGITFVHFNNIAQQTSS